MPALRLLVCCCSLGDDDNDDDDDDNKPVRPNVWDVDPPSPPRIKSNGRVMMMMSIVGPFCEGYVRKRDGAVRTWDR
jgi:hypothetical protein